ncbi:MAG: hypothetical protein K2Y37_11215 [Pirellulales bacterium]|nr:hypothetical protein [Pirellulales bacterium]
MSRYGWLLAPALALLAPLALSGCAKHEKPVVAEGEHDHEHAEGEHGHEGHDHPVTDDPAAIKAELAKLSPEDMKLVELQDKKCIVSDEPLGAMGAPVKILDVNGKDVFICCSRCEEALRKEPDKYLAKLKQEPAAETTP